jgi:hypothetical protein
MRTKFSMNTTHTPKPPLLNYSLDLPLSHFPRENSSLILLVSAHTDLSLLKQGPSR